jgi:uncharacterized protein (DUF58 family)
MTRRFTFVIFLLLLLWIGTSYLKYSVFRLAMIALMILVILTLAHVLWARTRIGMRDPIAPKEVTRGQMLQLHFPLDVRLFLIPIQLRVKAWFGLNEPGQKAIKRELQITAGPKEIKTIVMQLESRHLGPIEMGDIEIRLRDLFGLFRVSLAGTEARFSHQALVLPKYEDVDEFSDWARDLLDEGERQRQRTEDRSDEIDTIRNYLPGDTMKKIHWKLSSRKNEFIVKQYEIPKEIHFLLLTDPTFEPADKDNLASRDRMLSARDSMLEDLAGVSFYLLSRGLVTTLVTHHPEKMSQTSAQVEHLRYFRRQIALIPQENHPTLSEQLERESRGKDYDYYILQSTRIDDDTLAMVKELSKAARGVLFVVYYRVYLEEADAHRLRELMNAGVTVQYRVLPGDESAYGESDG